jgi:hypothetical protein
MPGKWGGQWHKSGLETNPASNEWAFQLLQLTSMSEIDKAESGRVYYANRPLCTSWLFSVEQQTSSFSPTCWQRT